MSRYPAGTDLVARKEELYDEAAEIIERAEEEGRDLNSSEAARCDEIEEEMRELNEAIEERGTPRVGRRAFEGADRSARGGPAVHTRGETMSRENEFGFNDSEYRAVDDFMRTGEVGVEEREGVQSIGTAGEGGILASTVLASDFFDVEQAFGGVRNTRARVIRTEHGQDIKRPMFDDVNNTASFPVDENSTNPGTTNINMSQVTFSAHKAMAGPVTVSVEQLQDSQFPIVDIVLEKLRTRVRRGTEEQFANSTVTSTTAPSGLITASTGAVTMAAGSSNLTLQVLRDLRWSVDPAYRAEAEWAVSDAGQQAIMDLEDSDGRPLVEPSLQEGEPARLLGDPIRVVPGLPDLASSSNRPILYGDMRAFGIRDVNQVRIKRLDERFALQDKVGFMVMSRHDSRTFYTSTVSSTNVPIQALRTTS